MTLAIGLSLLIGLLLGLLGGGGSILTVPMLVYLLNLDPKNAIATSLVVVGTSSLIAILPHARNRQVCWKSGAFFGFAGMFGAYGGGRLAAYFSGNVLMALFGVVTLAIGLLMLRKRESDVAAREESRTSCPERVPYGRVLFDGFFVGAVTGLVGVGGGFLIVPALTILVGLPMPAAIGTSLLVIVMNAMAGLLGYLSHLPVDLDLTATVTVVATFGAIVGAFLASLISAKLLRRLFGVFVILIASYVLTQSLTRDLLTEIYELVIRHSEFFLGVASLALAMAVIIIGQRIHGAEKSVSTFGTKSIL